MEVEDFLSELLDVDQLYGKLVCLVFFNVVKIFEALVQIFGISCEC